MQQLIIDQEFKELIPPMDTKEFQMLEESIINEGCREPLIIWNGILVDGHNRYAICTKNNIEFKTITKEFGDRTEVKIWIIKNQLGRRNLQIYDRTRLAMELEPLLREQAKKNKQAAMEEARRNNPKNKDEQFSPNLAETDKEIKPIDTREEVAKIANVSHGTLDKVKTIKKAAESGDQKAIEVEKKLQSGEIKSIDKAYREVKPKKEPKPKPIIQMIAEKGTFQEELKKEIVQAQQDSNDNIGTIYTGYETIKKEVESKEDNNNKYYQEEFRKAKEIIRTFIIGANFVTLLGETATHWTSEQIEELESEIYFVEDWLKQTKKSLNYAKENIKL